MEPLKRNLIKKINNLLEFFPVVALLGGRQCGKTTLAKMCRPDWAYFDLERDDVFDRVNGDSLLFLAEHHSNIIIDEAQKSPILFNHLRGVIDQDRSKKGRFLLTGSSSFDLLQQITETLAGRIAVLEIPPMKMNELEENTIPQFYQIFNHTLDHHTIDLLKTIQEKPLAIKAIKEHFFYGGYPEPAISKVPFFFKNWMDSYFHQYINRDIRTLYPRLDLIKYRRLLSMLSYCNGRILNKSDIAREIEVGEKTVRDYLEIIAGTYFWFNLPAYKSSKIKNTISMPKGYFVDSSLSFFLRKIESAEQFDAFPDFGRFFEGFVIQEIIRGVNTADTVNVDFFHYRTKKGAVIDVIINGSFGTLPIEIKYASHTKKKQISTLIDFVDKHDLPLGLVINNCQEVSLISQKIIQFPVGLI